LAGLPAGARIDATDFDFRVATGGDPTGWASPRVPPSSIDVRRGAGAGGSDRVTITWPSGTIVNQWLHVTLKATAHTNLQKPDVFSFGNVVGETGDRTTPMRVSAIDLAAVRRNYITAGATVPTSSPFDFNRDGRINALDLTVVRSRVGRTSIAAAPPPLFSDMPLTDNALLA
jgi:hypothetical protein